MNNNLAVFHKRFISTNILKIHFEECLKNHDGTTPHIENHDLMTFMHYWYSSLNILIEGWKQLKFEDEKITALLQSPNVKKLNKARDKTFHFIRTYHPEALIEFMKTSQSATWCRELHEEFGRYCLKEIKEYKPNKK